MKLKLKVSKKVKKDLKDIASKAEIERNEFVLKSFVNYIASHEDEWVNLVDGYPEFIVNRAKNLESLKEQLTENESITKEEQMSTLKAFYKDNKMFLPVVGKQKKLENIIVHLDEKMYYALQILAENRGMVIEDFGEKCLHHFK